MIIQWLGVGLAVITVLWQIVKRRLTRIDRLGIVALVSFLLSLSLMFPISAAIWALLRPIAFVDFTWRVLAVTVFFAAILLAYVVARFPWGKALGVGLLCVAIYANRNHIISTSN